MKKNKNILSWSGLVILICGIITIYLLLLNDSNKHVIKESYTVGAILPETNDDYSSYAKQLKKGMVLAEKLYNDSNSIKLKIFYEDDAGVPNKTISAFNKLIDINKVSLVIGSMFSNTAEAVAPVSYNRKTVLLSPTASSIALTNAGKYFFRIYPSDNYDGAFLANFINTNFPNKKVAIINEKASSIDQIIKVFKTNLSAPIIFESSIEMNTNIISSVLSKLREINPDIIFFPGNKNFMVTILKQSKNIGLKSTFITISTFNDNEILKLTKGFSDGVIFSTPAFDINNNSPEMTKFRTEFKRIYHEEPDILAGYGYDVVNVALIGVIGANNSDSIINKLLRMKNFRGVTGNASFDSNGDVIKSLEVMIVKNNKFERYEEN